VSCLAKFLLSGRLREGFGVKGRLIEVIHVIHERPVTINISSQRERTKKKNMGLRKHRGLGKWVNMGSP
jgi:hypothetical protein